jgi:phosphohistidine phosphatase
MPTTRVYLVRHGAAESKAATDAERRLTGDGRGAFEALLRRLRGRLEVSRIVTSPFVRARETADLLAAATGAEVEEDDALASGRSSGRQILALARRLGAGTALVGHNPEVAEAIGLVTGKHVEVKPGAVAALDMDAGGERVVSVEAP